MSHCGSPLLDVDAVDADVHDILTMSVLPLGVMLPALLLEHDDLVAARLTDDRCDHRSTLNRRASDLRLIAADHQHFVERDFVLLGSAQHVTLDLKAIAFGYAILLSPGTDDGV